jgi:hypothetical protein
MRKLCSLLFIVASIAGEAQNHFLGVTAGSSWANISTRDSEGSFQTRNALSGGITYQYLVSRYFTVGADLQYSPRGFVTGVKVTDYVGGSLGTVNVGVSYDYLALALKAGVASTGRNYFFASLGLTPSYLLKAKSVFETVTLGGVEIKGGENELHYVAGFDVGGMVEGGYGFRITKRLAATIAASYQHSFTDFYLGSPVGRHYLATVSLGIKYALKP